MEEFELEGLEYIAPFVDAVPDLYFLVNEERQIVFGNRKLKETLGESYQFLGKLPGDILKCKNALESEEGCGSTAECTQCGALDALKSGLSGVEKINECRIEQSGTGKALDFRVWASPFESRGKKYAIIALSDISSEKRRQVLERMFFHDVMNTAGGLNGLATILKDAPEEVDEFSDLIYWLSEKLIDEIRAQSILSSAETSELKVDITNVNTLDIVSEMVTVFGRYYSLKNKKIDIDSCTVNIDFKTDYTLLRRVLLNMLKNAVEATPINGVVTIGCNSTSSNVEFWVHNSTFIPEDVQLKLFKRSFSTKGVGRGIGTYSMKLITEQYLNGRIRFESDMEYGTVFTASFPI